MHTSFKKQVIFDRKVFKMQRYSSVTLHVSPKNQISREKLKITSTKFQISIPNFFPEWFGPKQIEAIHFRNGFHDKFAQTDCSKEMWVPISKGLKHLNTVIIQCVVSLCLGSTTAQEPAHLWQSLHPKEVSLLHSLDKYLQIQESWNKNHHRMIVVPMLLIISYSWLFVIAVAPTAVRQQRSTKFNWYQPKATEINWNYHTNEPK